MDSPRARRTFPRAGSGLRNLSFLSSQKSLRSARPLDRQDDVAVDADARQRRQVGSGRRARSASHHLRDRGWQIHLLPPLQAPHGRDPGLRPRRRRLLLQDLPPRRPTPAPPRLLQQLPPRQCQERPRHGGPRQDGRSGKTTG
uniref:Uncharacterized protein n=1 Tax=Triticum urartu TaxID=4572 RepID=A0A8R7PPT0_TRIUA